MRSKKHSAVTETPKMLPLSAAPRALVLDPFLDNLSYLLSGFGFRQVVIGGEKDITALYRDYYDDSAADPAPPQVVKWFYLSATPAGHELGIFIIGEETSLAYAHLLNAINQSLTDLGINGLCVAIGSRGCPACQGSYVEALRLQPAAAPRLCEECLQYLRNQDLAPVWNCRHEHCQDAFRSAGQQMIDFLDEECRSLLMDTLETIDALEIPYVLHPHFMNHPVRRKILFEVKSSDRVLGQGGNYSSASGGNLPLLPVIGFLAKLETWPLFMSEERSAALRPAAVFVVSLGSAAGSAALRVLGQLRAAGIAAAEGFLGRGGIRGQLKLAAERKSEIALIIGQKEAMDETVILRDIRSGMQEVFVRDRIVEEVQKRLAR